MRIVIATDSFAPKVDGVADTAAVVARTLVRRGHQVRVVAPHPGETRVDGFRVLRERSIANPLYPELRLAVTADALRSLLCRRPPDGLIVLTPGPIGVRAVRLAPPWLPIVNIYTTDVPHYLHAYGLGPAAGAVVRVLRWMAHRSTATLCPTEVVRRDLAARGFPRLHVWGRGVDLALFNPARRSAEMRRRLTGGEVDKPLVLYVGRLAREKRLTDLYAAARMLSGARFALVGDGPERDALERRFATIPSVFTGYLRGEPLAAAFASSDVFAFPSDSETFGQVVLQAMASGVPPIVVAGSAPAEFVPNHLAGIHVPALDPPALARAIVALTADPARRAAMALQARRHAGTFDWTTLTAQLEGLLAEGWFGEPPAAWAGASGAVTRRGD
jgi:glycosyltransferase involved in cell wall biosynthesis